MSYHLLRAVAKRKRKNLSHWPWETLQSSDSVVLCGSTRHAAFQPELSWFPPDSVNTSLSDGSGAYPVLPPTKYELLSWSDRSREFQKTFHKKNLHCAFRQKPFRNASDLIVTIPCFPFCFSQKLVASFCCTKTIPHNCFWLYFQELALFISLFFFF